MSARFRLILLGAFALEADGRAVGSLPRKAQALLALLALRDRPMSRERAADLLWTTSAPDQARHSLRQTLWVLNSQAGGDFISAKSGDLWLDHDSIVSDAAEIIALANAVDRETLSRCAALYRGSLLENLSSVSPGFDEWLLAERARLSGLAMQALRRLADAEAAVHNFDAAVVAAAQLVALDELREDGHRLLIQLLAAAGRRGEALRQYEICAGILRRELDVPPDPDTVALVRQIRDGARRLDAGRTTSPTFLAPCWVADDEKRPASNPISPFTLAPALPEKARIAVLPFRNMSDNPDHGHLAEGLAEEIVTALSRVSWLSITSPSLSFSYRGSVVDLRRVAGELGVQYVVEGSVRAAGGRARSTYRLVEAKTGTCLASDRFDLPLDDILDLQEKVALGVTGAVEPVLQAAEAAHSLGRPAELLTPKDLYLRSYAMALSSGARFREALPLLEQAMTQDPHFAPAAAWASVGRMRLVEDGRSDNPASDCQRGIDHARHALEVAGGDPAVMTNCALALAYFGEDIGLTTGLIDRALKLNPGHARGWHVSGMLRFYAGDLDAAIEHVKTSMRLSPRSRVGWGTTWIGAAQFLSGRFNEGVATLKLAIQEDPSFPDPYRFLAACYAHMNRLDKARRLAAQLRKITPEPMPDTTHMRNDEQREMLVAGLRLAGTAPMKRGSI
ncbi:MAG TPA: BTAD domain-containing putative transcriptional regulator [Acetobacteraceae bacterium]|nr:BTAD domain-containing putative transcriptional regulator [Acetobacteraceae bacterium]